MSLTGHAAGTSAELLRRKGLKRTKQRLAVLEALAASGRCLAAADVHEAVQPAVPGLGLATVYRTLELLARLGLIARVHLPDGCHRYQAIDRGHQHQLICSRCGLIVEFPECSVSNLSDELADRTRFQIEGHWLQFFGRCEACATSTEC